jgi:DNA-binding SARP family transcriptional activator
MTTQPGRSAPGVLCLGIFGPFAMRVGDELVQESAWKRTHAMRMLQYLASSHKMDAPRNAVFLSLWPGFGDDRARNRLHHTIHYIRKALEDIAASARPQIVVHGERIRLILPPGSFVDAAVFVSNLESDEPDPGSRLNQIVEAADLYRGPLAAGWDDCAVMLARRTQLDTMLREALDEGVGLAVELGQPAVALRLSRMHSELPDCSPEAQCRYALLLAESGRADLALQYCQAKKDLLNPDDAQAAARFAEAVRLIQRQANKTAWRPLAEPVVQTEQHEPTLPATTRVSIAPPAQHMLGNESAIAECREAIEDPFSGIISIVGPPGTGKSLLAGTVASQMQNSMRHGALWIGCSKLRSAQVLLTELLAGLLGTSSEALGAATLAQVRRALQPKELLIVLDGVRPDSEMAQLICSLAEVSRDTRWIVTSWMSLNARAERVIRMATPKLLEAKTKAAPTLAAQLILQWSRSLLPLDDVKALRLVEQIAALHDGHPGILKLAARQLDVSSPSELWARLQRDASTLLRQPDSDLNEDSTAFVAAIREWMEPVTPTIRRALALLSCFRTWLTREDIANLVGAESTDDESVTTLIDVCIRSEFVIGRTRVDVPTPWSEFRVPRLVRSALALNFDPALAAWCRASRERWALAGAPEQSAEAGRLDVAGAPERWFDDHLDDLDEVAAHWVETGHMVDLATLCLRHAPYWLATQHALRVLVWLEGLGESMEGLEPPMASRLLIERARVRAKVGQFSLACEDAGRALRLVGQSNDQSLRDSAVELIELYGTARNQVEPRPSRALSTRGIEAGHSLLRVAQLAVRHGHFSRGESICAEARRVFEYFYHGHGLTKTHLFQAKIAYATGDTEGVYRALHEMELIAERTSDLQSLIRVGLFKANLHLSEMRFAPGIELVSRMMADTACGSDTTLLAIGVSTVAWAHYGQGAYPLALALSSEMRNLATLSGRPGLQVDSEILAALAFARRGANGEALRHVCIALELLAHSRPMSDVQNDTINAAELASLLGRSDLAAPMLHSLDEFGQDPKHRLRFWVHHRSQALSSSISAGLAPDGAKTSVSDLAGVLSSLAST